MLEAVCRWLDVHLLTDAGTYGDYGAYKRDAAAAPVEKREPEAEAEAKPEADPEAKPQYGELSPSPTFKQIEGVQTKVLGDYGTAF
jgi:hypothetical protein